MRFKSGILNQRYRNYEIAFCCYGVMVSFDDDIFNASKWEHVFQIDQVSVMITFISPGLSLQDFCCF
jgi:hypothetical protein